MSKAVELLHIYQCFSDETRLRILNLLREGPLCVCHFQEVLGAPQVKISKHLAYLREKGLVEVQRYQNWMIYRLPEKPSDSLARNLECLHECAAAVASFRRDQRKLHAIQNELGWLENALSCCPPQPAKKPNRGVRPQRKSRT